ncbi:hypothetical protein [Nostoc sp. PA-18-2419]|uniref:hypothetical protein n=1 Tax=Nostoc sp. PA-18-2419 TaxID=2575443 RepID=UPI0011096631|nr:hypothetical protein [Nostoc sp. PA-18-2419]
MARRFNNLKSALKYLRPPGANENSVVPDAPEGTQLRKFQDFKAGKVVVKVTRNADSLPGDETSCSLKAFADLSTSTTRYLVNISGRALSGIANTGLNASDDLNIDTTPTNNVGLEKVKGFVPAKATVSVVPTGAGSPIQSKITGNSYKKKAIKTYTYPFGIGTTHNTYKSVKAAIITKVTAPGTNRGVSFKPEKF